MALSLSGLVVGELDRLLAGRQNGLRTQQLEVIAMAAAGVLLGVLLLWWSIPPKGRADAITDDRTEDVYAADVASVSVQLPAVNARDLLALEELVHVGRGVRARPRDEVDDAR